MRFKTKCFLVAFYLTLETVIFILSIKVIIMLLLANDNYNSSEYTVETDYTKWVTTLPAISICPSLNTKFVVTQLKRHMKIANIKPHDVKFVTNLIQPGKNFCLNCTERLLWHATRPSYNLSSVVSDLTPPCESELLECSWNGMKFSCCTYFQKIATIKGSCYSLNSRQISEHGELPLSFITSFLNPSAELLINSSRSISVEIHDRLELPSSKKQLIVQPGEQGEIHFKFQETVTGSSAKELTLSQRGCFLDGERVLNNFKQYSRSACKLQCLAENQERLCGCKHHLIEGSGKECSLEELKCLDQHFGTSFKNKKYKGDSRRKNCSCKPHCSQQEIKIVFTSIKKKNERKTASLLVKLTKPPTERLILNSKTTIIETIVALACLSRLITTATLHDIFKRAWSTVLTYFTLLRLIGTIIKPFRNPSQPKGDNNNKKVAKEKSISQWIFQLDLTPSAKDGASRRQEKRWR